MASATQLAESLYKTPALVAHRVRCGKSTCRCADGEGHGPYHFLLWREGAIQRRRYVRHADVPAVKAVCDARRARKVVATREREGAWRHWRALTAAVRGANCDE